MSELIFVYSNKNDSYSTINLTCVLDEQLSWKAKGLHTYLVSRPKGWKVWRRDLLSKSTDGRDSMFSALTELKEAGYVHLSPIRENGKFKHYMYMVFEQRTSEEDAAKFLSDFGNMDEEVKEVLPRPEKPYTEKPYTEKPYPVNRRYSIRELLEEETEENRSAKALLLPPPDGEAVSDELKEQATKITLLWNMFADKKTNGLQKHRSITSRSSVKDPLSDSNVTLSVTKAVDLALRSYDFGAIKKALRTYCTILSDPNKYYVPIRPQTLHKFLLQKNGLAAMATDSALQAFERKPFLQNSSDPFDKVRLEFKPITETYDPSALLDSDRQTYYGFKVDVLKNISALKRDIDDSIENKLPFSYGDFWKLETIIAALLFKRKHSPDIVSLETYFSLWKQFYDKFKKEKDDVQNDGAFFS